MYASHTKLGVAEACPRRYRKLYIEKQVEDRPWHLAVGGWAHQVFAEYGKHCMERGLGTDITAMPEIVHRVCFADDPLAPGARGIPELSELATQFASSHVFRPERIVGIEERIPQGWAPPDHWPDRPNLGDRHYYLAVIDLLEAEGSLAIITDYKTDWAIMRESALERSIQLKRYAWAVHQQYPELTEFLIRLDFIRHGVVREVRFGMDAVEETEAELLATVDRLAAMRTFPATPGEACTWCGFTRDCPAIAEAPDVIACTDAKTAQELAGQLLVLEGRVARIRRVLSEYAAAAGPIRVNDVELGHFKSASAGVGDVRALANYLQGRGLDPWGYLDFDGRKLKTLLRRADVGDEIRARYMVDRSYTQFRLRKMSEEEGESA